MAEPSTRAKTEVQLSRGLVVKGTDIRKMDEDALLQLTAKLLDVAQDAGARLGKGNDFDPYAYYYDMPRRHEGLVRFVLDDFEKLQEEAYEKAIADARSRAERLARLSRVELGPIVAVREIHVPGEAQDAGGDEQGAPQAAGRVEVPGDPDQGRAPGAVRGPPEGRGEGAGGGLMTMRRSPSDRRDPGGLTRRAFLAPVVPGGAGGRRLRARGARATPARPRGGARGLAEARDAGDAARRSPRASTSSPPSRATTAPGSSAAARRTRWR